MKLSESNTNLLRYPILIISIVIGLILARFILGIDFSSISKISTTGIEFQKEAVQNATGELEQRIADLEIELQFLQENSKSIEKGLPASKNAETQESNETKEDIKSQNEQPILDIQTLPRMSNESVQEIQKKELYIRQLQKKEIVSDNIIGLSKKSKNEFDKRMYVGEVGYLWVGNYHKIKKEWKNIELRQATSDLLFAQAPSKLAVNEIYRVANNLNLRKNPPENSLEYIKSTKTEAVIPRGTKITVLEKPKAIYGNTGLFSIWIKVRVED